MPGGVLFAGGRVVRCAFGVGISFRGAFGAVCVTGAAAGDMV